MISNQQPSTATRFLKLNLPGSDHICSVTFQKSEKVQLVPNTEIIQFQVIQTLSCVRVDILLYLSSSGTASTTPGKTEQSKQNNLITCQS